MKPLHNCTLLLFLFVFFLQNMAAQADLPSFSPNHPGCAFDELNQQLAPSLQQEAKDFVNFAVPELAAQARNSEEPLLSVAVVVHVIHEGEPIGTGRNISTEQVEAQIEILNEDFASLNSQYFNTPGQWMDLAGTPNIQFCLANVDPDGNATNGIDRVEMEVTGSSWSFNNINSTIKPAVNWNPNHYLNMYVVSIPGTTSAGGVVGYSNYPTPSLVGAATDGPVIDYNWFGAPNFPASGYRPITHELGHYFGLPHTFNGNSCSSDDNIADTPEIEESTRAYMQSLDCNNGYPAGPSSCSNDHLYVNYMDYVNENCYTSFTQGQVNVIRSVLEGTSNQFNYGSREELLNNAPLLCDLPANDAGITRLVSPESGYCTATEIAPQITLRNFGTTDLTMVNIAYKVNGGTPVEMEWEGSLFSGQNVEVTLPSFLPPDGSYEIEFYTENPNGVTDERTNNDNLVANMFGYVAIQPPLVEDFEDENDLPTNEGFFGFNPTNDNLLWLVNEEASGFGEGSKSAVIDNYAAINVPGTLGTLDALISRHLDLSEMTNTELRLDVAYAPYNNVQSDTLFILIATNCTQNFDQAIFLKGGNTLATAPATSDEFTPTSTQWRTEIIDLSAYDGMDDVSIAFVNLAGWGNRLFIDNLKVGYSCGSLLANWQTTANGCGSSCTGSATVEIPVSNGNLNYQWEGWPTNHNQPTVYQLCPGEVTVTVTDDFGCEIITSSEIQQTASPLGLASSTDVSTYGVENGSATVEVSSGTPPFTYSWSNGTNESSNNFTHSISGLAEGDYDVTVTDANDCASVFEMEVGSVCTAFNVAVPVTHASCFGAANGSAMVFPTNGVAPYEYAWNNGANTQVVNDLAAGEYTVSVSDANGCPFEKTVTIEQPTEIILTANSTNETALNAEDGTVVILADGGSPGYDYLWSNGVTTPMQTGLPPGTYSVLVTDLAGCEKFASVTVQPFTCDDFTAVISWTNVSCFGFEDGTANVAVTGATEPVEYMWSNGETTAAIFDLPSMEYVVTVSDAAGCMAELVATVLQPTELLANAFSTDETAPNAEDGTASVMPSGGVGYPWRPLYGGMEHWRNGFFH